MVLKTFNVQQDTYERFSRFCREHGVSMSKQVEIFMGSMVEEEPEIKREYLDRLERIKKGKFHRFKNISELRAMIESE